MFLVFSSVTTWTSGKKGHASKERLGHKFNRLGYWVEPGFWAPSESDPLKKSCTHQGQTEARERLRKPDTNRVLKCQSFARKYIMTFYWLAPFADSFVNSDCLELVIYFRTNKQESEKNAFLVNFSDNSDLRRGFKESLHNFWDRDILILHNFWDRDILRRTAESHRYVFRS